MDTAHSDIQKSSPNHSEMLAIGRKLKVFAGIVAAGLVIGFFVVHHMKAAVQRSLARVTAKEGSAPPIVDVITVQNAPSSFPLTLPGETAAWYDSTIYARVDGYVAKWNVDIGDHVQKGQILATIETPDLDAELVAAQAKLKADRSLVVARQADTDFAKTTYQRWKESPKGVVSEQERDAKKAGYDSAVAQLDAAQRQVDLDQAAVDRYTALAQFKQVTAPYTGIVTERHIDIGNLVTAGSTTNTTLLYRMEQDDPIRVFVDVPQNAGGDIKIDALAQVKVSNIPNRTFHGKVTRTANAINPKTRTLRVEVDIPNADHAMVPGMYVTIAFQVPTQGPVQLPAATLIFRSEGPQIAVIDKSNRIAFRKVTIVRDNGNMVELGSGVSSGDRVALNVSNQIVEGDTVEAHEWKDGAENAQQSK